jgi:hypothetical protein
LEDAMNDLPGVSRVEPAADVAPAVRVLRFLAGLLQLASVAAILAPWLAGVATRHLGLESPPSEGWVRVAGIVGFILTTVARIALPGGRPGAKRERLYADLATMTGGRFSVERRRLSAGGFAGGATVRWDVGGATVTLEHVGSNRDSSTTRFAAPLSSNHPLRFAILPRNVLTRMVTSKKFLAMVQINVKTAAGPASPDARAKVVNDLAMMAADEARLGHSELDDRVLVKANDAEVACRVLTGRGAAERMMELGAHSRWWTLSYQSRDGDSAVELVLDLPGTVLRAEELRAGKAVMEAVLAGLADQCVTSAASRRAS